MRTLTLYSFTRALFNVAVEMYSVLHSALPVGCRSICFAQLSCNVVVSCIHVACVTINCVRSSLLCAVLQTFVAGVRKDLQEQYVKDFVGH